MQDEVENTILKELREFRTEENKRWEENEKRWEENTKHWEENDKRWDANNERLANLESATKENTEAISKLIENNKPGIMDAFDRMEKSISKRFDNVDKKFDKIYSANLNNDIEHVEIKQILVLLGASNSEAAKRIEKLEKWKKGIDGSLFAV